MAASTKSKESEYSGKPTKKSADAPMFDIGAALAEDSPGTNTGHFVAGSSVTSTDEAEAMEEMISDMQEEHAFEQELKDKGLRNIIGNARGSGKRSTVGRKNVATTPHTSRLSSSPKPEPEPKSKPTRKTRKTKSAEPEPVEEEEETPVRRNDSEVNDDGDFSDFSF
jgi:hypothetical protein